MKMRGGGSWQFPAMVLAVAILCTAYTVEVNGKNLRQPETIKFDTGGLSRGSFAAGFTFGMATSTYQVEGTAYKEGRGPSIWDVFIKIPGN